MNKKDIAHIRKQFKANSDLLHIHDIYNIYIQKESNDIYYEESQSYSLLDIDKQELFFTNFKKVLGGKLDTKLFEVKFARPSEEELNHTQKLLYEGLETKDVEEWKTNMQIIAKKTVEDVQYEKDLVITFIRGEYFKPTKQQSDETDASIRDEVYTTPFILCSMNQTELPKHSLIFDYTEKEFKSNMMVDPVINLTSPVGGFLFPCFANNAADVNRILYAAGKANKPDFAFIENVLNGEDISTAQDEKAVFEEIVREVVGDEVNTQTLSNVYNTIQTIIAIEEEAEEETPPVLDAREVERVLKISGVEDIDSDKVESAFRTIVDDDTYEIKAAHVVPSYTSKSIKINTKVANIAISPQDLKYVKQVDYKGRRCLLIEVEEDAVIEGFTLISEELVDDPTE